MNNIMTEKWLEERNILLEESFTSELHALAIVYKKPYDSLSK